MFLFDFAKKIIFPYIIHAQYGTCINNLRRSEKYGRWHHAINSNITIGNISNKNFPNDVLKQLSGYIDIALLKYVKNYIKYSLTIFLVSSFARIQQYTQIISCEWGKKVFAAADIWPCPSSLPTPPLHRCFVAIWYNLDWLSIDTGTFSLRCFDRISF